MRRVAYVLAWDRRRNWLLCKPTAVVNIEYQASCTDNSPARSLGTHGICHRARPERPHPASRELQAFAMLQLRVSALSPQVEVECGCHAVVVFNRPSRVNDRQGTCTWRPDGATPDRESPSPFFHHSCACLRHALLCHGNSCCNLRVHPRERH